MKYKLSIKLTPFYIGDIYDNIFILSKLGALHYMKFLNYEKNYKGMMRLKNLIVLSNLRKLNFIFR